MKFLVVDDSATMRRILVNSLQRIGYSDCVEAEDGQQALEKFDARCCFQRLYATGDAAVYAVK